MLKLSYFNWSNMQGYFFLFLGYKREPLQNKTTAQDILIHRSFNYSSLCKLQFLMHRIEHRNEQANVNILVPIEQKTVLHCGFTCHRD